VVIEDYIESTIIGNFVGLRVLMKMLNGMRPFVFVRDEVVNLNVGTGRRMRNVGSGTGDCTCY
jgi:hypothetical protein